MASLIPLNTLVNAPLTSGNVQRSPYGAPIQRGQSPSVQAVTQSQVNQLDPWLLQPSQQATKPKGFTFHQAMRHGNCFFLAALDDVSRHPKGQKLLDKMVQPAPSLHGWLVTFPGHPQVPILVTPQDLKEMDKRKALASRTPEGVNILETAYVKLKMKLNPTKFKDLANPKKVIDYQDENLGQLVLKDLTGWPSVGVMASPGKSQKESLSFWGEGAKNPAVRARTEAMLNLIGTQPNRFLATACTVSPKWKPLANFRHFLSKYHDYAIRSVDPVKRTVTLADPGFNELHTPTLSYEAFMKNFCYMALAVVP